MIKTQGPCEDPNLPPEYMSWDYDSKSGLLKHQHSGLCLKVSSTSTFRFLFKEYMKIYENIWEYMRIYENIWEYMRTYENILEYMRIYENIWEHTRIYENIWEHMRIYENIWEYQN